MVLFLAALFSFNCLAQNGADAILGKWLKTPNEDLIIEVYRSGDLFSGKITWSKNDDKRKPVGFIILEKLQYNSTSKVWENGKIRDPNSKRTYDATLKILPDSTLEVDAYMGLKIFGKRKYFKRTS